VPGVRVKLNLLECLYVEINFILFQPIRLIFTEETRKVFHLEQSFVCCWSLDSLESRSEKTHKILKCEAGEVF
jgi:hypothetical protein